MTFLIQKYQIFIVSCVVVVQVVWGYKGIIGLNTSVLYSGIFQNLALDMPPIPFSVHIFPPAPLGAVYSSPDASCFLFLVYTYGGPTVYILLFLLFTFVCAAAIILNVTSSRKPF